jgi:hypothetical protein
MLSLNALNTLNRSYIAVYAKVFAQIFDGSLCTHGPWEALVTFQQLLVLADQEGNVDMTAEAISRRTTIPLEIIKTGIAALLKPDPQSRTPTELGRRIIPLSDGRDWGWLVVNYKQYRQLKREEDRREYHRDYWHTRKKKEETKAQPHGLNNSTATQLPQPNQPIAEAKAEKDISQPSVARPLGGGLAAGFDKFWAEWPKSERKHDKAKCLDFWRRNHLSAKCELILADVAIKKQTQKWIDGFCEAPLVYLRGARWEDGVEPGVVRGLPNPATVTVANPAATESTKRLLAEQEAAGQASQSPEAHAARLAAMEKIASRRPAA